MQSTGLGGASWKGQPAGWGRRDLHPGLGTASAESLRACSGFPSPCRPQLTGTDRRMAATIGIHGTVGCLFCSPSD